MNLPQTDREGYLVPCCDRLADELEELGIGDDEWGEPETWLSWTDAYIWETGPDDGPHPGALPDMEDLLDLDEVDEWFAPPVPDPLPSMEGPPDFGEISGWHPTPPPAPDAEGASFDPDPEDRAWWSRFSPPDDGPTDHDLAEAHRYCDMLDVLEEARRCER